MADVLAQSNYQLGFDTAYAEQSKDKVIAYAEEVLAKYNEISSLKVSTKSITDLIAKNRELQASLAGLTKTQNDNTKATIDGEKAEQAKLKTTQESTKQTILNEKAEQEAIKTKKLKTQASDSAATAASREKKIEEEVLNDYKQLSLAYNDAALKAKNYALRLGETNPVTVAAVKNAREMYDILLRVDSAVGQNQRNVGNYKEAFNGLQVSFSQVARELPSLAVSANTFLLAISNNLPMVIDEVRKAKDEIKVLQEQGKETPNLIERIATSFFNWNMALNIGIALLTIYGTKVASFIAGLFDSEAATLKATEATKKRNDSLKEQLELEKALQTNYENEYKDNVRGARAELEYLQAGNKSRGEQLLQEQKILDLKFKSFGVGAEAALPDNAKQQELEQKALDARIKYYDAYNQWKQNTDDEAYTKSKDLAEKEYKDANTAFGDIVKLNEDKAQTIAQINAKAIEIQTYKEEQARKVTLESAKLSAEAVTDANQRILNSDTSTLDERLKALNNIAAAQKKSAEAELAFVVNDPSKKGTADLINAYAKYKQDKLLINRQLNEDLFQQNEDYRLKEYAALVDIAKTEFAKRVEINEELKGFEELTLQQRLQAQQAYQDAKQELITADYKAELRAAHISEEEIAKLLADPSYRVKSKSITDTQLKALTAKYYSSQATATHQGEEDISAIMYSEWAQQIDERVKNLDKIKALFNGHNIWVAQNYASEVTALSASLNKGEISYTTYLKKRKEAKEKYDTEVNRSDAADVKKQIEAMGWITDAFKEADEELAAAKANTAMAGTDAEQQAAAEEEAIAQKKYDKLKGLNDQYLALVKKGAEAEVKTADDAAAKQLAKRKELYDALKKLAQESIEFINVLATRGYEIRLNQLQEEQDKDDENYQRQVNNITNSTLTEQQKADTLKVMEAEKDERDKARDREKREIKLKEAKFEKAQAIASIVFATAVAIAKASPNPVLIALAAAIGAVQLATAIARPLPAYAKGTRGKPHEGGPARIGEGGKTELVTEPGLAPYFVNTDQVRNLRKGTEVFNSDQINEAMQRSMFAQTASLFTGGNTRSDNGTDKIVTAIKGIKQAKAPNYDAVAGQLDRQNAMLYEMYKFKHGIK